MFDLDKWNEILETIGRNVFRTVLTMLGVSVGMLALIILVGFANGLQSGVSQSFGAHAVDSYFVWPRRTTMPYKGLQPGRIYRFKNDDITALQSVPEIDLVCPRLQLGGFGDGNNVTRGDKAGNYEVMGDYPGIERIKVLRQLEGRFMNQFDLEERRKICVIGSQVRAEMFNPGESPVGKYLKIQGVYFRVVGVADPASAETGNVEGELRAIYIPFSTFQQAFNANNQVNWFAMFPADGVSSSVAEQKARDILYERHMVNPKDQQAMGSFNVGEEFRKFNALFLAIKAFVMLIGVATLMAGAVGISNIMIIVVKDRTKEIGTRKALGATPWSIISMILQETVVITLLAGFIGIGLGVLLWEAVDYFHIMDLLNDELSGGGGRRSFGFELHPYIQVNLIWGSLLILVICGMVAAILPAIRAVRVNPVEALRTE